MNERASASRSTGGVPRQWPSVSATRARSPTKSLVMSVPGWSGSQRLARLLPEPVLKEMALFGRRISAIRPYTPQVPRAVSALVSHLRQLMGRGQDHVSAIDPHMALQPILPILQGEALQRSISLRYTSRLPEQVRVS